MISWRVPKGKRCVLESDFLPPHVFSFGYVRVLVIFRLLLAVPLKFGLPVTALLTNQG